VKTVAFHTLGCKVNQVETEQIKEDFIKRGYSVVDFNDVADVYIINTCTVTHVSDRKSRAMVRRAIRKNPRAIIAAIGCMAQINAKQLADIKGVDLVVGNSDKEKIADIIENLAMKKNQEARVITGPIRVEDKLKPVIFSRQHQRTRAFIKIQDGCQSFCSYCIVPYTRGPVRSKLPESVIKEIKQLLSIGYREIVLTGIHTGLYGSDLNGWDLAKLLRVILDQVEGDYRIRLSSIEPLEMSEQLVDIIALEQRLCRHFHISLQSGSDKVLKAMYRRYTSDFYRELIYRIANKVPDAAFTTDVMVGFPGENNEDFKETYKLIIDLPVMDLHVFKYSPRPGTKAAALSPQVEETVKQQRSEKLLQLAQSKHRNFIKGFLNREMRFLVERKLNSNQYTGLSDNYINVEFLSNNDLRGNFTWIMLKNIDGDVVKGELCHTY